MHEKYGLYKQLFNVIQNFRHFRVNIFLSIQLCFFLALGGVLEINHDSYMIKHIRIELLHHFGKYFGKP